jgi:hypothetical protein
MGDKINLDRMEFGEELQSIITKFKDGTDEPLDGDEVDVLTRIINAKINLIEGNITDEEYLNVEFTG